MITKDLRENREEIQIRIEDLDISRFNRAMEKGRVAFQIKEISNQNSENIKNLVYGTERKEEEIRELRLICANSGNGNKDWESHYNMKLIFSSEDEEIKEVISLYVDDVFSFLLEPCLETKKDFLKKMI